MIVTKFSKEAYDNVFPIIIETIKQSIYDKDDDFFLMCIGATGSGKSMLSLHGMELYLKDKKSIDYVGFTRSSYAKALITAAQSDKPRMCINDEANVSKRDSITKYNKDVIGLFYSNRGANTFHWWNNPSLDMLDKSFINERIKGVIYVKTKDNNLPRLYYFFWQKDIKKIMEKYKTLDINILKRVCKKYAYYRGWFRDYTGDLKKDYLEQKNKRILDVVQNFHDTYCDNLDKIPRCKLIKKLKISDNTMRSYENKMKEEGLLVENEDYEVNLAGRRFYSEESVEKFIKYAQTLH